jgi:hypothetical protein
MAVWHEHLAKRKFTTLTRWSFQSFFSRAIIIDVGVNMKKNGEKSLKPYNEEKRKYFYDCQKLHVKLGEWEEKGEVKLL